MHVWSRYARPRGPFCPFRDGWNDLSRLRSRFGIWRRAPRDGLLAGVCAGLADALHVQPLFVRLGFVAMGLMSGPFAVVAYIVLAAVLPADQAEIPPHARPEPEAEPAKAAATDFKTAAAELAALRARLADCDRRTAELERKVVADNLDLDRAIRDLGK